MTTKTTPVPEPWKQDASAIAPARAVTDGETILATVDVSAPPARVFRALTTNQAETWWGAPDAYRITDWSTDLVVCGNWSLMVRLPNGGAFPASGKFLEIDTPRKVVQTRKYDWDYPGLGRRDTTVTYLMEPISSGTRVTVRHDGFTGIRQAADEHVSGWERLLGWLAAYLKAEGAPATE